MSHPFTQERDTDPETSDATLMAASLDAPTYKEPVKTEVFQHHIYLLYLLVFTIALWFQRSKGPTDLSICVFMPGKCVYWPKNVLLVSEKNSVWKIVQL